jgi:sarcosine oxidase gamma subunit
MEQKRQEGQAAAAPLDALHDFAARFAAPSGGLTGTLDAVAAEVLAAFRQVGVEALLLKGRALAILLYRAGEQRDYSDVDLLVAPHDLDAAEATLRGLGYENSSSVKGIDDIGGVVHADTWIPATPGSHDQAMIDVHRWLPGARATPGKAWGALAARRTWIEIEGRQAAVLDRAGQAMHLATHAAQHGPAFPQHVDELALALERWPADVWDSAAVLAKEIDATDAFAAGLRLVSEGAEMAERLALGSTAELDWKIRHRHARPRGTFHLQALADARGARERVGILRRSLLPSQAWIKHQHPWARAGGLRVIAAYGAHLARAPGWAVDAWLFRGRARRAGRAR